MLAVGSDPTGPGVERGDAGEERDVFIIIPVVELVRGYGRAGI